MYQQLLFHTFEQRPDAMLLFNPTRNLSGMKFKHFILNTLGVILAFSKIQGLKNPDPRVCIHSNLYVIDASTSICVLVALPVFATFTFQNCPYNKLCLLLR